MGPVSCLIIQDDPPSSGGQQAKYTGGVWTTKYRVIPLSRTRTHSQRHSSPVQGSQPGLGVISAGQDINQA